jgi:dihydrofolate reductase
LSPSNEPVIEFVLIAAVADNGVIGRDGAMPWRLRSDLRRFRALTMGKPVVMGRKTFQSIGRPLDGRTTIVVTRDPNFAHAGVMSASTLEVALACARGEALRRGVGAVMIAGGAEIYAQSMPFADEMLLTLVHDTPAGSERFPPIDPAVWREVERETHRPGEGDSASFTFVTYRRAGGRD